MSRKQRTLSIATFGQYGTVKISISTSAVTKDVLVAIGKHLKIKENSLPQFALFTGPLGRPITKLQDGDQVTTDKNLCLQRWGINTIDELRVLRTDDIALHLLYSEAMYYYTHPIPKILPTPEERQLLEEYSDPQFPTERQFLETIMNAKGYSVIQATNCILQTQIATNACTIPINSLVVCTCYKDGLEIKAPNGLAIKWEWRSVKRWKIKDENKACFEVCSEIGNTGILEWMIVETYQAPLLLQSAMAICSYLLYQLYPERKPVEAVKPGLPGRHIDPLYEFVNTALFGSGPKFSAIHDQ